MRERERDREGERDSERERERETEKGHHHGIHVRDINIVHSPEITLMTDVCHLTVVITNDQKRYGGCLLFPSSLIT